MKEVVLSNEELDIIDRLQNSKFPSAGYDPYEVCFKELGWFRNQKRKKQQQGKCTSLLPFRAIYAWLTLHFFCCSCKEILFEVCRHILLGHICLNGEHELNPNDCALLMIQ